MGMLTSIFRGTAGVAPCAPGAGDARGAEHGQAANTVNTTPNIAWKIFMSFLSPLIRLSMFSASIPLAYRALFELASDSSIFLNDPGSKVVLTVWARKPGLPLPAFHAPVRPHKSDWTGPATKRCPPRVHSEPCQ